MTQSTSFIAQQTQKLAQHIKQLTKQYQLKQSPLVCVASKYASVDQIRLLYSNGHNIFGENKMQDAIKKIDQLQDLNITWHFIGHLQKNKVRKAVEYFNVIQSVDSLDLLEKINAVAIDMDKTITCYIQLNTGKDPNKHGLDPDYFLKNNTKFFSFSNVKIKGIMVIAPLLNNQKELKEIFNVSFEIFDKLFKNSEDAHLSMGMSQDYQLAISSGATMVRIGRMLFKPS